MRPQFLLLAKLDGLFAALLAISYGLTRYAPNDPHALANSLGSFFQGVATLGLCITTFLALITFVVSFIPLRENLKEK